MLQDHKVLQIIISCSQFMANLQAVRNLQALLVVQMSMLFLRAPPAEKCCVEGLAPKAMSIVFSRVMATAANKFLRDFGINEVKGFEHTPLVIDDGTLFCHFCDLLHGNVLH